MTDQESGGRSDRRLLIVDFGSQVTQLIARRLRELGIYCQIHPFTRVDSAFIADFAPGAIILSGGPARVGDQEARGLLDPAVFAAGVPVLGICYGQQVMMQALGGQVVPARSREFGHADLFAADGCSDSLLLRGWFTGAEQTEQVWMSHGDTVSVLAPDFEVVATSSGAPFAVVEDRIRSFYGVQFHPEVSHTPLGKTLLRNFAMDISGVRADWTMASFATQAISAVRAQVGGGKVICGLSGGVDSAVTAAVVQRAVDRNLRCVFVDTGLLRAGEASEVICAFTDRFDVDLIHIDASEVFFAALSGVTDPEEKRKRIGKTFIEVFEKAAADAGGAEFLAQGTLYPDVIESFSAGPAATIKSHHNVGGLPERMNMQLVEPLRELFKDEVRTLGRELGLPGQMVDRHPFPGPGLAIRIPGEVTRARADLLRQADAIYLDEIRAAGLYGEIWQAFAVLLPVQSVGVMGDARAYDPVVALRAVTSTDGMTADYYRFDHEFLSQVARRIVNDVPGIGRVVYDITSKPPGTIEWE